MNVKYFSLNIMHPLLFKYILIPNLSPHPLFQLGSYEARDVFELWTATRIEMCSLFNLPLHYNIYIVEYLFFSRDDKFEGETTVLVCKTFPPVSFCGSKMLFA